MVLSADWLDKYGGAERVISALNEVFDFSSCFTLVNLMKEEDIKKTFVGKKVKVINSNLQFFGFSFRKLILLFPFFVNNLNKKARKSKADLIISSSFATAKSLKISNAFHISYFQARNMKYIWDEVDLYFNSYRKIFRFILPLLRKYDIKQASNPNVIIVNSIFVQQWVKNIYGRDSIVIYPPVDVDYFKPMDIKEEYYVTVGRIVEYKRFDTIVEAFNKNKKRLVIVGSGSMLTKLKKKASSNIEFTGFLDKSQVYEKISKAKAFIYAGVEDFGISLVEAQACGTPVIAYDKAGAKEIVIDGKTGVLFKEQTANCINSSIDKFENNPKPFSSNEARENSLRFSKDRFKKEISDFVNMYFKTEL
ncbi:glycosyltransferase family 4 protein [Lutibacter sp. B1]|nr:glycosyltransferase family 4 protein [Lutibacter sp. B1]